MRLGHWQNRINLEIRQQSGSFEVNDKIHFIWPQKEIGYFERTLKHTQFLKKLTTIKISRYVFVEWTDQGMSKLSWNINRQEKGTKDGHYRGFWISKLRPERGTRPESLKSWGWRWWWWNTLREADRCRPVCYSLNINFMCIWSEGSFPVYSKILAAQVL
jgi:hypothetical protein